ncbi:MAG: 16S rRNA (cytosine(1402)-N(4))-methyltransferase RsmH [Candidatus Omnitrophica bacterium]|nr:16S rRNA (cytosine(1402)-N(4))-methyltransferase RsmH [Candidatus Omnitrophota bacterium]
MIESMEVEEKFHIPVMLKEVVEYLNLSPGKTVVDATVGTGGHSLEIIKRISPGGKLIAIDRDNESLAIAKERLRKYSDACEFIYANFVDMDKVLAGSQAGKIDGVLFDLGISSVQLDNPERGFSFQNEGPLDMRVDREGYISAYDLINNLNEDEISGLLRDFGQERWHNRIARSLVRERQKHPISTTSELCDVVVRALPPRYRHYRIHPATRTFQAVRIAVNRELENLQKAMDNTVSTLKKNGRICVISFHSLEDRVVKFSFRNFAASGLIKIITPKPLTPDLAERADNPSSRSAKLRVAERI